MNIEARTTPHAAKTGSSNSIIIFSCSASATHVLLRAPAHQANREVDHRRGIHYRTPSPACIFLPAPKTSALFSSPFCPSSNPLPLSSRDTPALEAPTHLLAGPEIRSEYSSVFSGVKRSAKWSSARPRSRFPIRGAARFATGFYGAGPPSAHQQPSREATWNRLCLEGLDGKRRYW